MNCSDYTKGGKFIDSWEISTLLSSYIHVLWNEDCKLLRHNKALCKVSQSLYCKTQIFVRCSLTTSSLIVPPSHYLLPELPGEGLGPYKNSFLGPPARVSQQKIFTLNHKDCQLQHYLGLVWKGWFVHSTHNDTVEKDSNMCNIVKLRELVLASPIPSHRHCPPPSSYTFQIAYNLCQSDVPGSHQSMSSSSTAQLITPLCRDTITPSLRKSEHQTNMCISINLQGLSIVLDTLTLENQGTTCLWNAGNYETNQTMTDQKT
jgi:hypothetical protein